jgi:SprA-related family
LSATDRHVRAHEQAHLAAAGPYATSSPSYSYTVGPDGKLYAVAGEVSLDVSPDPSDPRKTIEKARAIEAAANAPVDPSPQDRMVAAQAAQMERAAEQQLEAQQRPTAYSQHDAVPTGQLIFQMM